MVDVRQGWEDTGRAQGWVDKKMIGFKLKVWSVVVWGGFEGNINKIPFSCNWRLIFEIVNVYFPLQGILVNEFEMFNKDVDLEPLNIFCLTPGLCA